MILAVDPGLRCLGWMVWHGGKVRPSFGVVRAQDDGLNLSERAAQVASLVFYRAGQHEIVACEGPHRRGYWTSQEELARVRQSIHDKNTGKWMEVNPLHVKKALGVPAKTKGKDARIQAARSILRQWPEAFSEFESHKKDSRESIADALGIALAAQKMIDTDRRLK